jgi:hypothetical protein
VLCHVAGDDAVLSVIGACSAVVRLADDRSAES